VRSQVLIGDRLVGTPYDVSFRVDHENERVCSKDLTSKDLKKFRKAVKDDYYFQVRLSTCYLLPPRERPPTRNP
jgi:hypothetical protein